MGVLMQHFCLMQLFCRIFNKIYFEEQLLKVALLTTFTTRWTLSQVYSKILSRFSDCFISEHIFDNYFLVFLMANMIIKSRNYPQNHPISLLFFKKATRQILHKNLQWRSTSTQLNLNKIYWNTWDLIFLYRCSFVDLLHDLA